MRILFATFLVLNFLVETLASVSLIAGPNGLAAAGSGGMWSMHYGFAAFAIASASLWAWPQRHNPSAVTAMLGLFATFHTGLFISLTAAGDQQAGMVIHAVLAALAITLFALRGRITGTPAPA